SPILRAPARARSGSRSGSCSSSPCRRSNTRRASPAPPRRRRRGTRCTATRRSRTRSSSTRSSSESCSRSRTTGPICSRCAARVLVAVFAWELVVSYLPVRSPGSEQGLTPTGWEPAHAGAFAANVVLFACIAPFVEELTFRGVGQSLLRAFGRVPSILGIGVMFGIWHGLVEALLVLIPFGVALAYLRDRTRSVVPGMVVHGLFNAIALVLSVV